MVSSSTDDASFLRSFSSGRHRKAAGAVTGRSQDSSRTGRLGSNFSLASLGSVLASRKSPVRSTTKGASSLELARDTWPTRPLSASARDNDDVEVVDAITAAEEI